MSYEISDELQNYDIYPKVILKNKKVPVTVKAMGHHAEFDLNKEYTVTVCALNEGCPRDYKTADFCEIRLIPSDKTKLVFDYTFTKEEQYFVRIKTDDSKKLQLSVYCVESDLAGRYPFMGDLHMHTCRSDGRQAPEIVAANYRKHGYDFLAITDHERYYSSLEAIDFYKDVPTEFNLVPGEEVHMTRNKGLFNDVHIVNFGGEYSINALVEGTATKEKGRDKKFRTVRDTAPDIMTADEYTELMLSLAEKTEVPEGVDKFTYACCKWEFDKIRDAGGLGIFAHPYWISDVFQVPEKLTDYLMETQPFDAFEVLGGENYFEQNGFQTLKYYKDSARGRHYPIVGSTDSHSSFKSNRNAFICSTIVFSPENERSALISSIKDFYSVAVDGISAEFRIVGDMRLSRYACFLLKNYFPLHDELCFEEGRLMREYACGDESAKEVLSLICGRVKALRNKYFSF